MRTNFGTRQRKAAGRKRDVALDVEIASLTSLPIADLRSAWTTRFGSDPPPIRSGDVLLRLLAWRLQADALGGLDRETEQQIRRIGRALERDGTYEPQIRREVSPGVLLTREWKGVTHKVTVTADGFRYQDIRFRSLSDIARTITGTRWSGPRFFGLEQKPARMNKGTGA